MAPVAWLMLTCACTNIQYSAPLLNLFAEFEKLASQYQAPDVMRKIHAILFLLVVWK